MKKNAVLLLFLLFSQSIGAQEASSVFNFLKIPVSAHAAALGGTNISLIEDDPSLIWGNPALLSTVSDKSINLNYMTYLKDCKVASASFVKSFGERHTVGFTAQFLDYGSMDETNESGTTSGTFSAKDISVGAMYSYTLSNRWVGGATMKFITSKYAEYSSSAIAFDLGLNYYDDETDFSWSTVIKNVGAQLSSFNGEQEHLPFDLQTGFTKRFAHAPFQLSITMVDLTRWSDRYFYNTDGTTDNFGKKFFRHFVFGVDLLPSDNFYISAGYSVRRARELKAAGSTHGAGWSFGGGLQLSRLKFGVAYSKYHVSASSLLFNLSYTL